MTRVKPQSSTMIISVQDLPQTAHINAVARVKIIAQQFSGNFCYAVQWSWFEDCSLRCIVTWCCRTKRANRRRPEYLSKMSNDYSSTFKSKKFKRRYLIRKWKASHKLVGLMYRTFLMLNSLAISRTCFSETRFRSQAKPGSCSDVADNKEARW